VRINLAGSPEQCLRYAGELLAAFLREEGIDVTGEVRRSEEDPEAVPPFYVHRSAWTLGELLEKMFRFSNNFMANQIFLAMGASRFGPPATPEKARRAVGRFLASAGVGGLHVEEGSGLSRRTRITARQMIRVLERFRPHRRLLECRQGACTKTGTLHDVKSLAGYLGPDGGNPVSFVILLNGKEHGYESRKRIFSFLRDRFSPARSE
jgi:D-alanyl-D-alanine carboxypeptidase/D-alanyl-D-alanine-endopeptidase (penicillin-binding protein 4)